ncbi:hypothetical protein [Ideonella paludis]|uniref:Uncharacterized protein n=1 Tax=Ideonella paludis TaxID=1233411 RepID=A0ABS5E1I3_9BURK|nr:hypothetical protein [Ideonella paludis]MBQ0937262.1 hypothetical protein [Ideonella paludis]
MSSNKGAFREEGTTSIRHVESRARSAEELKEEALQGLLSYLKEHERTPWRPEPRYENITDLKIEIGDFVAVGCELGMQSDEK